MKGIYDDSSDGKSSDHASEQGDFVRLIMTHDSISVTARRDAYPFLRYLQ